MIRSAALTLVLAFGLVAAPAAFAGPPAQSDTPVQSDTPASTATATDAKPDVQKLEVKRARKRSEMHERLAARRIPFYSEDSQFDELLLSLPQF